MGADCTSQDLKSNKTGLHLAVQEGNVSLVDLFLQHPAAPRLINMKAHGHTALHMAAALPDSVPRTTLVRLLLARGADPSARNLEHEQPAHLLPPGPAAEQVRVPIAPIPFYRPLGPPIPAYWPPAPFIPLYPI
ncbi:NF-kappa-B inhibitor delta isoform X1 [Alligator sinensis]|uniref:NF-kappa-B inhibitor delta isoform X1 n=1 Tax=Alligator sinensis TaxID=38654 RepID=A0A3Q0FLJ0_ALLSI|nr:NF-kappa-B inhibitor delta isoform X1 [Alligator sinensis]